MSLSRLAWIGAFAVLGIVGGSRETSAQSGQFYGHEASAQVPAPQISTPSKGLGWSGGAVGSAQGWSGATGSAQSSGCYVAFGCYTPRPPFLEEGPYEIPYPCLVPGRTIEIPQYRVKYYVLKPIYKHVDKIVNVGPFDVCVVCGPEKPCPSCVAAGGFGKGNHAGELTEQLAKAIKGDTVKGAPAAPAAEEAGPAVKAEDVRPAAPADTSATRAAVQPQPAAPVVPPAPAATRTAELPAAPTPAPTAGGPPKQWVWLSGQGMWGFGFQRPDGYWVIERTAPPTQSAARTTAGATTAPGL